MCIHYVITKELQHIWCRSCRCVLEFSCTCRNSCE